MTTTRQSPAADVPPTPPARTRLSARLTASPAAPRGAYRIALTPAWQHPGPLAPLVHTVPTGEEDAMYKWAARLCWLDDPRTSYSEPKAPRMFRSAELALPPGEDHTARGAYTYPVILRFADPDAADALAAHLTALAAQLRQIAPDPYGGCANCVRAEHGVCEGCARDDDSA